MKSIKDLVQESLINEAKLDLYTITYGTAKEKVGKTITVLCDDKSIETVAIAIYKGHNQSGPGWCYYTDSKGHPTTVADCM